MPDEMTDETKINAAVAVLRGSERGRTAMRVALHLLDAGGLGLDQRGQIALLELLALAFASRPMSVRDAMREGVGS